MIRTFLVIVLFSTILIGQQHSSFRWYKGNTHTHTLNSDGDSTPDEVVKWYRDNDYNFLVMTDHEFITPVEPLNSAFGKVGDFLVISGQEVTDRTGGKPHHVNALGTTSVTQPKRGNASLENIQANVDAIRLLGGVPQINHPNFGWALTAETIARTKNVMLFELYNAHPQVNNLGGGDSPSTEEIWDRVLTSGRIIYGVASDDVHTVRKLGNRTVPTPGHGWVMVRASELTPKAILQALDNGDFYASTGVELSEFATDSRSVTIKVKEDRWSKYRIRFIGKGGMLLQEFASSSAVYKIKGNEGYVRAKVFESNGKLAWTQPVVIQVRKGSK